MSGDDEHHIEQLLETPDLADALGNDRFKQFLDHLPVGIAVAEFTPAERVVYVNPEFERLTGHAAAELLGGDWAPLGHLASIRHDGPSLAGAIVENSDHLGDFIADGDDKPKVDAWSNVIEGDDGSPVFRLVALVARETGGEQDDRTAAALALKDTELSDLQHRVKNNLQMITSLIRFEARALRGQPAGERFERLAGRVGALSLLYQSINGQGRSSETVDLGVYLSEIASAAMRAQARDGVRFEVKVDAWPAPLNTAMPAGLVVHELLSNALEHAFPEGRGGTISLQGLVDEIGWRVIVADDGVGLPPGIEWPTPGTMPALFVRSLQQNAHATVAITSAPDQGLRAEILFGSAPHPEERHT